jgi:translation initiation factor 1 (eIF-1/SUI1)
VDDLLGRVGFKGRAPATVSRVQLGKAILGGFEDFYRVRRAAGARSAGGEAPLAIMGTISNVVVTVERNRLRKDKFLTRVVGLEAFGVDVGALAASGSKLFACACSAEKNPKTPKKDKSKELIIHGNVPDAVVAMLQEAPYDIPRTYLAVRKAGAKKKKK